MKFRIATLVLLAAALGPVAHAEQINLASGVNSITYAQGPSADPFSTVDDSLFAAARNGSSAKIVEWPQNYGWSQPISGTKWVNVDPGSWSNSTALYAIPFNVSANATSATLSLSYFVDDHFGTATQPGIYVNGKSFLVDMTSNNWNVEHELTLNIGSLKQGTNWLYLNVVNDGAGPSGVDFSGKITTNGVAAVPEPASLAIIGIGALGLLRRRKRA